MESPDTRKYWSNTKNPFLILAHQVLKKKNPRCVSELGAAFALKEMSFQTGIPVARLATGSPAQARHVGWVQLVKLEGKI